MYIRFDSLDDCFQSVTKEGYILHVLFFLGIEQSEMTIQPNGIVKYGSSVTLTCKCNGYPAPRYLWYKDNLLINGTDCSTLILPRVTNHENGYYHCKASNAFSMVLSNQQFLRSWSM